jgi:hypothetical protein
MINGKLTIIRVADDCIKVQLRVFYEIVFVIYLEFRCNEPNVCNFL